MVDRFTLFALAVYLLAGLVLFAASGVQGERLPVVSPLTQMIRRVRQWPLRRRMHRLAKAHEWDAVVRIARELDDPNLGLYLMCAEIQALREALP